MPFSSTIILADPSPLPPLQHLMLQDRSDRFDQSRSVSPADDMEIIRRTPTNLPERRPTHAVGPIRSPRHRVSSQSLLSLLNDDSAGVNKTPRRQISHSRLSPDNTPRASDVSRFDAAPYPQPLNAVYGASPPHPPGRLSSRSAFISPRLPPPPLVRRPSESISENGSIASGLSIASGDTDQFGAAFSTTSSASSAGDQDVTMRHNANQINHAAPQLVAQPTAGLLHTPYHPVDNGYSVDSAETSATARVNSSRAPISRTTKACNACRGRKVRCDAGGLPSSLSNSEVPCTRCKNAGLICVYSAQQRKRGPTPGTRRGSGVSKSRTTGEAGEQASATTSRRLSSLHASRMPQLEDERENAVRATTRPAPYYAGQGPRSQHPSVFDARPSSTSRHSFNSFPIDPSLPSPTWTHPYSSSGSSASPITPYHPSYAQLNFSPGQNSPAPPPHVMQYYRGGPDSPSIFGWGGHPPPSPHTLSGHDFSSRNTAEEEAFRNGYSMALAQVQRQKELERGQDRDEDDHRSALPPILAVGSDR